jgi:general secretion pathway protein A
VRRPPRWRWSLAGLAAASGVAVLAAGGIAWQSRHADEVLALVGGGAAAGAAASGAAPALSGSSAADGGAKPAGSSTAGSAPAPAEASPFDPATDWAQLPRDESALWRELAADWSVELAGDDPCAAAAVQSLHCYRTNGATLASLRLYNRPGLLTLVDRQGRTARARLVALDARRATLAAGGRRGARAHDPRALLWRGEFATLWRSPQDYERPLAEGARGAAVQVMAVALARWRDEPPPADASVLDAELAGRLSAFQLAQGLKPDGIAGPSPFMLLNRAAGVDEPRLSTNEGPLPGFPSSSGSTPGPGPAQDERSSDDAPLPRSSNPAGGGPGIRPSEGALTTR